MTQNEGIGNVFVQTWVYGMYTGVNRKLRVLSINYWPLILFKQATVSTVPTIGKVQHDLCPNIEQKHI